MDSEKFSPQAKDIYKNTLIYVDSKEKESRRTGQLVIGPLFELAELIVDATAQSEQLSSYAVYYFDKADITRSHVVNVAVFATVLARGLGLSRDELIRTCAAGLLHDIGFAKLDPSVLNIFIEQLKPGEINTIRNHPELGYALITHSNPNLEWLASIIHQHHEKGDGSGYPRHLRESEMLPAARILSIIDTYEALLHPREHRDALIPPQGIQELIKQEGTRFPRQLIKTLVETISLYPSGCFVQLNSGEVARVIKTNPKLPTRPVVRILTDPQGHSSSPEIINLAENPLMTITMCIPPPGMTRIGT